MLSFTTIYMSRYERELNDMPPPYPVYPSPEHFDVVSRRDPQGATKWLNDTHEQSRKFHSYAKAMRETGKAPISRLILFESKRGNWLYKCLPCDETFLSNDRQEVYVKEHLERVHYLEYSEGGRLIASLGKELLDFRKEVQLGIQSMGFWQTLKFSFVDAHLFTREIALTRLEEKEAVLKSNETPGVSS